MKILVSGATGFIGKYLTKRLVLEGHEVWAIVRPSTNTDVQRAQKIQPFIFNGSVDELMAFMKKEQFHGVIHLASLFLAQHQATDVKGLIESNILFSTELLEASVRSETPWFINTGTFWQHYENKEYSPVNLYAATKQAFEAIATYYRETSLINFVTLKLSDTFGPDDTRPKVFNLWSKVSKSGEALDMSPGEQLIDISFIDNVIDGYIRLIALLENDKKRSYAGKVFAIRSSERMTLKELAQLFERVTHTRLAINWGKREYRPREVMVPWEKGETVPGWQPRVSIEDAIRRMFHE